MLRFHTQTAGVQLTAQQPEVNMARVTIQALAAVLGGTQSLHANSYDEAMALPSEKAARLAVRTQQVLAHETDLTATVDPFAGWYAIESMTNDIEEAAGALIARVEELGGAVAGIEAGFQKAEIERSAYQVTQQTEAGDRIVVGVNRFHVDSEEHYQPLPMDPAIEGEQAQRLALLRASRDKAAHRIALDDLKEAATGDRNSSTRCVRHSAPVPLSVKCVTRSARYSAFKATGRVLADRAASTRSCRAQLAAVDGAGTGSVRDKIFAW